MSKFFFISKMLALFSFLLGTGIFLWNFFVPHSPAMIVGLYYIVVAGIINLLFVLVLIASLYWYRDQWRNVLSSVGILLLNIPVVVLYIWVFVILLDTMRVTFINEKPVTLTDIKITGCESKTIDHLAPGESTTEWITIKGDCSISIEYKQNGEGRKEVIQSYLTSGSGGKIVFRIGISNFMNL
ncbi:MAG: hypothetical protein JWO03_3906 [Bacteroidetes bacterium]|nr:hypothetical protein [Bacteroidota bacterium]